MNYTFANVLVISAIILFVLAVIAWSRKNAPGAKSLAFVLLAIGVWSLTYGLRWTTDQLPEIYFWLNMAFSGIVVGPAAMLVFAIQYSNPSWKLTLKRFGLLSIEPIITLGMIWSDPWHHFFYGNPRSIYSVYDGGFWLWFNALYSLTLITLAVIVLIRFTRQLPEIARHQSKIIIWGYVIPLIFSVFDIMGLSPFQNVDCTPFSFISSGFLVIYGFLFHKLLDITPIAYAKLAQTTADALIILDNHWRIVDVNSAARKLFCGSSDLIGEDASQVFAAWPEILSALEKNEEIPLILQKTPDCAKVFDVQIIPLKDNKKGYEGVYLTFHDITRFQETEDALQASENKIRSLFLSITDNIFILDKDGKYLEIAPTNPQSSELINKDPFHLIGKTVPDVFPTEVAAIIMDAIHKSLKAGRLLQVDYPMMINGKGFWFSGNVGRLTHDTVIWVARDITERKQMEQTLRESSARLAMAQSISHTGSWEYNLKTEEFWASDEYYRILGIDIEKPVKSIIELNEYFTYPDKPDWTDSIHDVWEGISSIDKDIEIIRKGEFDSRVLHIIASAFYDVDNKPYKFSGVIQDITSQKQVEKALEKRMLALTRPLDKPGNLDIEDLFNMEEIQKLQDDFANATGVASLITRKDGVPITRASYFGRLCAEMIRMTEKGRNDCYKVDAELSNFTGNHPLHAPCLNIGCFHAGAPILVAGQHIATWVIGQVKVEDSTEETAMQYFRKLGLNEEQALAAYRELPSMSQERFNNISQALFTLTTQLSNIAYQNVQQARFITERRQAEEALQESEHKLRSIFSAMTDVIMIFNREGIFREVPTTGTLKYNDPSNLYVNKSIKDVLQPEIASLFYKTIQQTLELNQMTKVDYSLPIGGFNYWFSANVSPLTEDSVVWVARDITERKNAEDSLHFQSMHDNLTGLYNRQYYETEIERLQRSRLFPISILVMDVDGLKWVNDHRGHSMGDELLKRVAGVLKSAFRPEDMVARMGGDEFVVVLPQTDESTAQQAMQRLEKILEKHNQLFPADQKLGLSIGVATGGQGLLLTEIFKLADQAMYIMKNKKKELAVIEGYLH